MKRKVCVVTGTRAEYGLLYWLMREIDNERDLDLQIIATGMHLSPEYGSTYQLIEQDGFQIDEKIETLLSSDTPVGVTKSLGIGVLGFADAFARLSPDIVVLLGDRYEILAAAQAAMIARIPMAHIHGGECTEGAIDESIRHAITKMSQIHFVAAERYRHRVIQLGENPLRVFNVGAPGLDNIRRLSLLDRNELESEINFELGTLSFLVTYHPVTLEDERSDERVISLLEALDEFPNAQILMTNPNSDAGGRRIRQLLDVYERKNPKRVRIFTSMGQIRYLSALKHVNVVIGNSSSGIIEAPKLHTATVNIGSRQAGRLKADSVIDCNDDRHSVLSSIKQAISEEFQVIVENTHSLYGDGNAASQMTDILKSIELQGIFIKKFYDITVVDL